MDQVAVAQQIIVQSFDKFALLAFAAKPRLLPFLDGGFIIGRLFGQRLQPCEFLLDTFLLLDAVVKADVLPRNDPVAGCGFFACGVLVP